MRANCDGMRDFFLARLPVHKKTETDPKALLIRAIASDDLGVCFVGL